MINASAVTLRRLRNGEASTRNFSTCPLSCTTSGWPSSSTITLSYEHAAGHLAWALTAGAGWTANRHTRALDVIVWHNWTEVIPDLDVEGYLLEIATGLDVSGSRADDLLLDCQWEGLRAFPRLGLASEFGSCVTDQASRKPTTAASRLIANGLVRKLTGNPLESTGG